ncbi:hypothetical protein [Kitasatospora brasiliensis]|uniref:hypothetical protein n=1 Tax=Kitasatospora brasiliensis TaxID=3058040 RepID=UPI002931F27E|nr:hypothetical protein [Kitasatospora sp. K002]
MRSYTTKLTVAALAAATALSLAACGPDNADSDTPAGTGGAAGAAPAATGAAPTQSGAAPGATAGGAAGGSTAAPSGAASSGAATGGAAGAAGGGAGGGAVPAATTSVKFGQSATVDFADKTSKVATKLEITVTGVEVGSLQELTAAKVTTAGLEGRTPMYVSYTIKNLGDASLSFTAPDSKFVLFDNTGKKGINAATAATPLPKCTGAKFQGVTKGTEVKGCTIIATTGTAPVAVGYTDLTDLLKLQASWAK